MKLQPAFRNEENNFTLCALVWRRVTTLLPSYNVLESKQESETEHGSRIFTAHIYLMRVHVQARACTLRLTCNTTTQWPVTSAQLLDWPSDWNTRFLHVNCAAIEVLTNFAEKEDQCAIAGVAVRLEDQASFLNIAQLRQKPRPVPFELSPSRLQQYHPIFGYLT